MKPKSSQWLLPSDLIFHSFPQARYRLCSGHTEPVPTSALWPFLPHPEHISSRDTHGCPGFRCQHSQSSLLPAWQLGLSTLLPRSPFFLSPHHCLARCTALRLLVHLLSSPFTGAAAPQDRTFSHSLLGSWCPEPALHTAGAHCLCGGAQPLSLSGLLDPPCSSPAGFPCAF